MAYTPGKYLCRIVKQSIQAAQTGTPQVVLEIEPLGQINPSRPGDLMPVDDPGSYFPRMFWAITEKTIEFVVPKLAKLGYNHDDFDHLDPEHPEAVQFAGTEIVCECKLETYNGKTRERWDLPFESEAIPVEKNELKKLNALFGKHLKPLKQNSAKAAAPDPQLTPTKPQFKAPEKHSDAEIPF